MSRLSKEGEFNGNNKIKTDSGHTDRNDYITRSNSTYICD